MSQKDSLSSRYNEIPRNNFTNDDKPSMIFSILPAVLQNRIPTLPSIRRSVTDIQKRKLLARDADSEADSSTPPSPPPEYCSRPGSRSYTPNRLSLASTDVEDEVEEEDDDDQINFAFYEGLPAQSQFSISHYPSSTSLPESETRINWKYANQGVRLLTQAIRESNNCERVTKNDSILLTRQLYMHGMTYLLRGLPEDLTPEESMSISAAIPPSLVDLYGEPCAHAVIPVSKDSSLDRDEPIHDLSLLHRITATVVFQTFVLLQFLLPYVKIFLGHAYRFERKHNVTQRVVNTGCTTIDVLGRRGLQLSHTVCQMNDGKVGQAINDMTLWWIRGLTGGIEQGITDGVVRLGGVQHPENCRDGRKH